MKAIPWSHFLSDWAFLNNITLKKTICFRGNHSYVQEVKQSKWRRIEEENGPERGEFPLGGQGNVVVDPGDPRHICTICTVEKSEARSEAKQGGKGRCK